MKKIVVVYTTCANKEEAEKIGKVLMDKKLAACINIISDMKSFSLWPPKSGKVEEASEVILLIKTLKEKAALVEEEIQKNHSYDTPAIIAFDAEASNKYADWITGELT